MTTNCSACGQPLPPKGLALPPILKVIYETVTTKPASAEDLRKLVWRNGNKPVRRQTLHTHVHRLNRHLKPYGVRIRAPFGAGAVYRLERLNLSINGAAKC